MPPHTKRARINRKTLRQPDEFKTLTAHAVDWIAAHQALVGGVVAS